MLLLTPAASDKIRDCGVSERVEASAILGARCRQSAGDVVRSSGVARVLDGDPDSRTSLSMKSNAAPSETTESVEPLS